MKLWEGILAIHDTSGFGHIGLNIPGVSFYSDRALLLPVDAAVIQDDGAELDKYIAWLKSPQVRLGPKRVIKVKRPDLFQGLSEDPAAIEQLQTHVRRGGFIQIFCMTEEASEFFERHSIDARRIHAAPLETSRRMNDKAELRRIGKECGLGLAFLPYVATSDPSAVMSAVRSFLSGPETEAEFVVVKRTNLAGGDGIIFLTRDMRDEEVTDKVAGFLRDHHWNEIVITAHNERRQINGAAQALTRTELRDHDKASDAIRGLFASSEEIDHVWIRRKNLVGGAAMRVRRGQRFDEELKRFLRDHCRNEIIVEAGFDHIAFSTQIVVEKGEYRFLGPTRQIVQDGHHMGNIMVRYFPSKGSVADLDMEDKITMEKFSRDLTAYAHSRVDGQYVGTIGFDFMKRKRDGRIFMLECNGRQTAATYPLAINAQLEGRVPDKTWFEEGERKVERTNWGIVMRNAVQTKARTFSEVADRLGPLLFKGACGAIPFNIRLMELDEPAIGIVAVGETLLQSRAVMRLARRRLAT